MNRVCAKHYCWGANSENKWCVNCCIKTSIYCGIYQVINNLNLYSAVLNTNSTVVQKNTTEIVALTKKHTEK
jgi:hypothetical protein